MDLKFTPREEIAAYEWDPQAKRWQRPNIDLKTLKELLERSTWSGLWRLGVFVTLLAVSAWGVVAVSRVSLWLATPLLYVYYFFYGFWIALAHELQHKTVFGKSADWFSEILFFFIQTLVWNSPRYARISHKLHHRYTMVEGVDPETIGQGNCQSKWVRGILLDQLAKILVYGGVRDLFRAVAIQIKRIAGQRDEMMQNVCNEEDNRVIRIESAAILLLHLTVVAVAIWFRRWEPIVFITLAWHIGMSSEALWHLTQHVGRMFNMNDQRLVTRSCRVNPLIKLLYWGLDDHIEHHLFPAVPSRNLPKLQQMLNPLQGERRGLIDCWREMFAIGREKDLHPTHEYVPLSRGMLG